MTQNKRIRSCRRYHYDNVKVCRETDIIFTRCRICKELYPSTLDYFRKDSDPNAPRLIQPLCKSCGRELDKRKRELEKEKQYEEEKTINNIEEHSLFEDPEEETVESKVDRILAFLGLTKGTCKK